MVSAEECSLLDGAPGAGISAPRVRSPTKRVAAVFAVAGLATVALVAIVWSTGFSNEAPQVELAGPGYTMWLKHFGDDGREFSDDLSGKGNQQSLSQIGKNLDTAQKQLEKEITSLRQSQGPTRPRRRVRSRLPKDFSANRITSRISRKIKAYEGIRERAARYLLKNIAKEIINSYDKLKAARGGRLTSLDARRYRVRRWRRRGRRSGRRGRRSRRQPFVNHVNRVNGQNKRQSYQVNRGRYVVVVNQKNGSRKKARGGDDDAGNSDTDTGLGSQSVTKFKANDATDKRLANIARIATRAARSLMTQRKQLISMRRARKAIIKAATANNPAPKRRRRRSQLIAPVVIVSKSGPAEPAAPAMSRRAAAAAAQKAADQAKALAKSASDASAQAAAAAASVLGGNSVAPASSDCATPTCNTGTTITISAAAKRQQGLANEAAE